MYKATIIETRIKEIVVDIASDKDAALRYAKQCYNMGITKLDSTDIIDTKFKIKKI